MFRSTLALWILFNTVINVSPAISLISNEAGIVPKYPEVKILATTYFTHNWSNTGRYRQVSHKKKRLGNYVALNFLPSGSIIMIPELLKTTKLMVADTMAGSGVGYYKGKRFWKVDILRDKNEWMDDFDYPLTMQVVKINEYGRFGSSKVKNNYKIFLREIGEKRAGGKGKQ